MNQIERLVEMARIQGGYISASEVTGAGIPRRCLTQATTEGALEKVARGLYMLPDVWEDELYVLQHQFKKGVYSHETSLFLHGMADRTPEHFTMTFPFGYNPTSAKAAGVITKTSIEKTFDLGITHLKTSFGNQIVAYDVERTLCDIVKGEGILDVQLVNPAMKLYTASKEKNTNRLMTYAKALGVEAKIKTYMGVLL